MWRDFPPLSSCQARHPSSCRHHARFSYQSVLIFTLSGRRGRVPRQLVGRLIAINTLRERQRRGAGKGALPTGGTPTRFSRGLERENGSSPCAASSQSGFWNAGSFLKDSTFCVVLVLLCDSLKNSTRSSSVSHLLMCQLPTCP